MCLKTAYATGLELPSYHRRLQTEKGATMPRCILTKFFKADIMPRKTDW